MNVWRSCSLVCVVQPSAPQTLAFSASLAPATAGSAATVAVAASTTSDLVMPPVHRHRRDGSLEDVFAREDQAEALDELGDRVGLHLERVLGVECDQRLGIGVG